MKITLIKIINLFLFISVFFSCSDPRTKRANPNLTTTAPNTSSVPASSQGVGNTNTAADLPIAKKIDIRYFVDPLDGGFKTTLNLPKNFNGYLYITGLNLTSLTNQAVKVRFSFGVDHSPVFTMPATVARGTGITADSNLQVLILDFKSRPFQNLRLVYDLFDYNTYSSNTDEPIFEFTTPDENAPLGVRWNEKITQLYCRGLKVEDDPTFTGTPGSTTCNGVCKHTYLKIKDAGLYNSADPISAISSPILLPAVDNTISSASSSTSTSEFSLTSTSAATINSVNQANLKKCLPDNGVLHSTELDGYKRLTYTMAPPRGILKSSVPENADNVLTTGINLDINQYFYQGSYRPINYSQWLVELNTVFSPFGAFKSSTNGSQTIKYGINSLLFPIAGKLELRPNVYYFGSTTPMYNQRDLLLTDATGVTQWMDGCNIRASYYDTYTNEGIQSCNITATIEILAKDPATGVELVLANSNQLKLQVVSAQDYDFQGHQVLYQGERQCTTSSMCGVQECCFNNKCLSKTIIPQCVEDVVNTGNLPIGTTCTSDYECASLCCNQSTGRCSTHDTVSQPQVTCNKAPGNFCVAKDWCRVENVRTCQIVQTGTDITGKTLCTLRCFNVPTNGSCINGICVSPVTPAVPNFNTQNPDCSKAVPPPMSIPNSSGTGSTTFIGNGSKTGSL